MQRKTWIILAVSAFVACLLGATVVAAADLGLSGARDEKPDLLKPSVQRPTEAIKRNLSALDDVSLAAKADGLLSKRQLVDAGIKPGTVVLADTLADGSRLLVAPASGGVCEFVKPAAQDDDTIYGGCTSEKLAATGQQIGALGCSQTGITVYGRIPDGVASVSVQARGGGKSSAPVVNNTYAITVAPGTKDEALPAEISWDEGQQIRVPIPPDPAC